MKILKFVSGEITLFNFRGIRFYVSVSTLMFLSVVLILSPLVFSLMLLSYLSVVLHEYGHALTANWLRCRCDKIVLYPIGGIAFIENLDNDHKKEMLIIAAGPMVNVILGLIFFVPWYFLEWTFLYWIINIQIVLFVFNMVPIFPLDGGRLLRSLLRFFLSMEKATVYSVWLSWCLAGIWGVFSIINGNIWILFILGFISLMSYTEFKRVKNLKKIEDDYQEHLKDVKNYIDRNYSSK